jgi:hypothetical protein
MNAGAVIGVLILLGTLFFCMLGLLILLVILFAIIIPVPAASLLLAVRSVFKEDVTFKSAYFLMAIVLIVTAVVIFMVVSMGFHPWIACATRFVIGALLLGYMIQADDESIGVARAAWCRDHNDDHVGRLGHRGSNAWFDFRITNRNKCLIAIALDTT